jgi:hypothetical protein
MPVIWARKCLFAIKNGDFEQSEYRVSQHSSEISLNFQALSMDVVFPVPPYVFIGVDIFEDRQDIFR